MVDSDTLRCPGPGISLLPLTMTLRIPSHAIFMGFVVGNLTVRQDFLRLLSLPPHIILSPVLYIHSPITDAT
jgi:hypothetical protein